MLLTVSGLRRYPLSQLHLNTMPGRGLITSVLYADSGRYTDELITYCGWP